MRDQVIPAGKLVLAMIGSANRDPKQFRDPDRFDISPRSQPAHCLRARDPLLPGRAARAAGSPDRARPISCSG